MTPPTHTQSSVAGNKELQPEGLCGTSVCLGAQYHVERSLTPVFPVFPHYHGTFS